MNQARSELLDATFSALADPTRRAILARLARGDTRVGDLIKPFAISGPAISRHLRVLENARLIERQVDAQWRICRLATPGLQAADDWLSRYRTFWEQSLDRLVDVLERGEGSAAAPGGSLARVSPVARRPRETPGKTRIAPNRKKRKSS